MLKRVLASVALGSLVLLTASTPAMARGGGGHMGGGHMSSPVMMHRGGGSMARSGSGHFRSPMNRQFRDRDDFRRFRHFHRFVFFPYPYYPYYPSYCPGSYGYPPFPGPYPYAPAYCPSYYPYGYGGDGTYGGYGYDDPSAPPMRDSRRAPNSQPAANSQPMPNSQPMSGGMSGSSSGY